MPSEPKPIGQKRLAFSRASRLRLSPFVPARGGRRGPEEEQGEGGRAGKMCCCPSKACCICTLIVLVLVAVGLVFGFGIYTRGFRKLTSNIHLDDRHPGGSFRAYGHLAPPPPY